MLPLPTAFVSVEALKTILSKAHQKWDEKCLLPVL